MKKYIIISITFIMLILVYFITFFIDKTNKFELELTHEEVAFINQHKDITFFIGYYDTPSEKLVIQKLCSKLSKDTGLNISPFEGDWKENMELLQSGKLPMLANMNITKDRIKYTNFTSSLEDLPVGVYSNYEDKIVNYEGLKGKTIGVEKNVYLLDDFKLKYPEIKFYEKYYNNLNELKKALMYGEIDGFMTSEIFNEDIRFLCFFNIESISRNNNHIGVNKNYPILYSIIKKEVDYLIHMGWDKEIRELVKFELDVKQADLTDNEKKYIEKKEVIRVGIPKDFSFYAYGDEYNPKGIIPAFFKKIEIFTDLDFIYSFDSYENLINRKDIDVFVSYESLPYASTAPIFINDLIAISNEKGDVINEIYELEPYRIGTVNEMVFVNEMKRMMPYIDLKICKSYEELYEGLEDNKVDYAIVPSKVFKIKQAGAHLVNNGIVSKNFHYIYSKDNEQPLIEIINKCLSTMNMQTLVNEEITRLIHDEQQFNKVLLISILTIAIIAIIAQTIIQRRNTKNNLLYFDKETMLHNELWLRNKLKINYEDYVYYLVQPKNLNEILDGYGENAYKKALKVMVETLKDHVEQNEYVVKLNYNQVLIIKKKMIEQDRLAYMQQLEALFNKQLPILDINYFYEMAVVSLKLEDENYDYDKLLKKLEIGLRHATYIGDTVDYTYDVYNKYQSKIDYNTVLSSAIINEEVAIILNRVLDRDDQIFGYDVSCSCLLDEWGEITYTNLKRCVNKLGLEIVFDKIILKKLIDFIVDNSYTHLNILIEIDKKTLMSHNFFEWLKEKLEIVKEVRLLIKIDIDTYEKLIESSHEFIKNNQLEFILFDFEKNITDNTVIKDYEIPILQINSSLFLDLEKNNEILDFIIHFSKKYNKKILVTAIKTFNQFQVIKEYDVDYYIDNLRGNENESINCRG